MEEGSLRCDANVSVMLKGAKEFGTKAEVKNVNSFRYIRAAVEHEIERQIGVLEDGGRVKQESRLWNQGEGRTYSACGRKRRRMTIGTFRSRTCRRWWLGRPGGRRF